MEHFPCGYSCGKRISLRAYPTSALLDDKEQFEDLKLGLRKAEASDGREGVNVLANLAYCLQVKLEVLANTEKVLSAGKVVMIPIFSRGNGSGNGPH